MTFHRLSLAYWPSSNSAGKLNGYVFMVALVAASGGLLFGYDLGVTGGVESMVSIRLALLYLYV